MIKPDIVRLSPNHNGAMPDGVKTVIIHCTRSGTPGNPKEFEGTLNYMAQVGTTSSQWVIGRKPNQKARVVPDNLQAWHAGVDNDNSWGIEIEQPVENDGFTMDSMWQLVEVCKGYVTDFGVPIRRVFDSSSGGFVGHQDTAQGKSWGKSDPGAWFNWPWFIQQLQGQASPDLPAGIGISYRGGGREEIWNAEDHPGEVPDGVGIRWPDGTVTTIWHP